MNNKQSLPPASAWRRLVAYSIDTALFLFGLEVLLFQVALARDVTELLTGLSSLVVLGLLLYTIGYMLYVSAFTTWFGGTIGKLLVGVEIVDLGGSRISFRRAFFRNYIGYMVSGMFLWLGFIWIFIDKDRRGWHDMVSATQVVIKSAHRWVLGVVALALVITANISYIRSIRSIVSGNMPLYQDVFSDVSSELSKAMKTK